jgi:hypothetical protein
MNLGEDGGQSAEASRRPIGFLLSVLGGPIRGCHAHEIYFGANGLWIDVGLLRITSLLNEKCQNTVAAVRGSISRIPQFATLQDVVDIRGRLKSALCSLCTPESDGVLSAVRGFPKVHDRVAG